MQSSCRRDADIHARDGRAPQPYDSFTAGFARARENITQSNTATNAPMQSIITSCSDAVRVRDERLIELVRCSKRRRDNKSAQRQNRFARRVKCPTQTAPQECRQNRVFREMSNLPQRGAFLSKRHPLA
jgi:hypothetical protein